MKASTGTGAGTGAESSVDTGEGTDPAHRHRYQVQVQRVDMRRGCEYMYRTGAGTEKVWKQKGGRSRCTVKSRYRCRYKELLHVS